MTVLQLPQEYCVCNMWQCLKYKQNKKKENLYTLQIQVALIVSPLLDIIITSLLVK